MRYWRRKLYACLAFGLWAWMMRCAYVIATYYVPQLPKIAQSLQDAVATMYWILPVWIVVLILWFFSPAKPPGTGTKLTANQKKMIKQAKKEVG